MKKRFQKLTLSEWAQLAEVIGAVAIIISLVYVAAQVSDNTRAIRSAVLNDASMGIQSWYLDISTNAQASDVFYRGVRDPADLTEAELFQFFMSAHAAILGFQNAFELADEGTLDEDVKRSITMSLLATRNLPGFKLFWEQRSAYFTPGFRAFVNSLEGQDPRGMERVYSGLDEVSN